MRLDDVATMACHGVPGCNAATIAAGAGVRTLGTTSSDAWHVDAVQYAVGDGPCLDEPHLGVVVRVDDHVSDRRRPAVGRAALGAGFRSSLSMPLRLGDRLLGALNMHARRTCVFGDWSERVGDVLARQAAGAISDVESARRRGVAHLAQRRISQTLQRELMPVAPALPGMTSGAR